MNTTINQPSSAYLSASWVALAVGILAFIIGLWNATMELNEKGYYLTLLIFGLFASISLQKSIRDKLEGIPVTESYIALCWFAFAVALGLLVVGLWNATILLSEKGFYGISFFLALYASISVQKNIRDLSLNSTTGVSLTKK